MTLQRGGIVWIPCESKSGPSADERLVSFETLSGRVTGFVKTGDLKDKGAEGWAIRAAVLRIKGDAVEVRVFGSFFNTNGLADISRDMALAA